MADDWEGETVAGMTDDQTRQLMAAVILAACVKAGETPDRERVGRLTHEAWMAADVAGSNKYRWEQERRNEGKAT